MYKYSVSMYGNYETVGEAVETFTGDAEFAKNVLFGKADVDAFDVSMGAPGPQEPDALYAVAKVKIDQDLQVSRIEAFKDLFPTLDIAVEAIA